MNTHPDTNATTLLQSRPTDTANMSASNLVRLERHPYSALFSKYDLVGDDLQALVESLRRDGLISSITTHRGKVLDGWNRFQACIITGVSPVFEEIARDVDPWEFVKAKNLLRRHQSPAERFAVMAAKVELDREEGTPVGTFSKLKIPRVREIAQELQVSMGTAHKAVKILRANDPELTAAVASNCVSMEDGAEIADLPVLERMAAVAASREKAAKPRAPEVRLKLKPSISAELKAKNQELLHELDAAKDTIAVLQEKCGRLESEVALLRVATSTVAMPLAGAWMATKLLAPGLESAVKESQEILTPETSLGLADAQVEG